MDSISFAQEVILGDAWLVIDANGNLKLASEGYTPQNGEVVLSVGDNAVTVSEDLVSELKISQAKDGALNNIDAENVINNVKQGDDPSQLEGTEPSSGDPSGSSLTATGAVDRDNAETIAQTTFDTEGFSGYLFTEEQESAITQFVSDANTILPPSSDSESDSQNDKIVIPTAVDDLLETLEDQNVTLDLLENDFINPDDIEIVDVTVPADQGTVHQNPDGSYYFKPAKDFNGEAEIEYTIKDGNGNEDSATAVVVVIPVNDAPTAVDDVISILEDTPVVIDVLENDSDIDGDDITLEEVSLVDPTQGSVDIVDGKVQFTPAEDFSGEVKIIYVIKDEDGLESSAEVVVNVEPQNDAPEITVTAKDVKEESVSNTTVIATFVASDADGDELTYTLLNNDAGYFALDGTNVILTDAGVAAINNDQLDLESLDITVQADDGIYQSDSTDTSDIMRINDNAPEITVTAKDVTEESVTNTTVIATFVGTDADGDELTYTLLNNDDGYFVLDGTNVVLTDAGVAAINNDELDLESLDITVQADDGTYQSEHTDTSDITRINDNAPEITVTAKDVTEESVSKTTVVATFEASDADGDELTYTLLNNDNGYFVLDGTNVVLTDAGVAAINNDQLDLESLDITVQADDGTYQSDSTDTSDITRVNDNAPEIKVTAIDVAEDAVSENMIIASFIASDADGDVLSYSLLNNDNNYFVLDGNNVRLTADGVAAINNDQLNLTELDITVQANDGKYTTDHTDTSIVNRFNDSPTASDSSILGTEDTAIVFNWDQFNANDIDTADADLSVVIKTLPADGTLEVLINNVWQEVSVNDSISKADIDAGSLRFTPDANESGYDGFSDSDLDSGFGDQKPNYAQLDFAISDGNSESTEASITIDITPVADKPDLLVLQERTEASINFQDTELPSGKNWSSNVDVSEVLGNETLGTWYANDDNKVEIGKESVYRSGASQSNLVLEIEADNGDNSIYTDISVEEGRYYSFTFDAAARRWENGDSDLNVLWVRLDDQGNPVMDEAITLYEFSPTDNSWERNIQVTLPSDQEGDYRLILQSTDANSYGAIVDNLILESSDAKGVEGEFVDLWDLSAGLTDTDGSETLTLTLEGLPEGTIIKDTNGNEVVVDANGKVDITGLDIATLKANVTEAGDYDVVFTAIATETSTGETASSSATLPLIIESSEYKVQTASYGADNIEGTEANELIVGDVQGFQIVAGEDYNIAFILDTSGSMGSVIEEAKTQITNAFEQIANVATEDSSGKVNIMLLGFSGYKNPEDSDNGLPDGAGSAVLEVSLDLSEYLNDPAGALKFFESEIKDISASGHTNYEEAFNKAIEWFDSLSETGANNQTFFITDGEPTRANQLTDVSLDSFLIGFNESTGKVETLAELLPDGYVEGTEVTWNGAKVIDASGNVISPYTGETIGVITTDGFSDKEGWTYSTNEAQQAQHYFGILAAMSVVEAIGIGDGVQLSTLQLFDSDAYVEANIDVKDLEAVILGKKTALNPGEDSIESGKGRDILFGDSVIFEDNGVQGVPAIQEYIAAQLEEATGSDVPVSSVSTKDMFDYISTHSSEFDQSNDLHKDDVLDGGSDDDILFGQGGNDILTGGSGDDLLLGGSGDDTLFGGMGEDIMTGGEGADTFVWTQSDLRVFNETDTIIDFSIANGDKIDLTEVFADEDIDIDALLASIDGDSTQSFLTVEKGEESFTIEFQGISDTDLTKHLATIVDVSDT
ncbi:tandem-95 repeat protein [Vibrio breoganii]